MTGLFFPLARLRSKGLIEAGLCLGHHFLLFLDVFRVSPVRHSTAFVQDLLGKAGTARPIAFKQIIESRRRPPGICTLEFVVLIISEPWKINLIPPGVIGQLNIISTHDIGPLLLRIFLKITHGLSFIFEKQIKPRLEVNFIFIVFLFFRFPRVHLEPNLLGVLPVEEVVGLGADMFGFYDTSLERTWKQETYCHG